MKIIDLLNKIANGEEVPEKIKVHNTEYHKCILKTGIDYKIYSDDFYYLSNDICKAGFSLNDEVEIIEEEKKIPEKIEIYKDEKDYYFIDNHCKKIYIIGDEINFMVEEFNQLIDYLKSKEGNKK